MRARAIFAAAVACTIFFAETGAASGAAVKSAVADAEALPLYKDAAQPIHARVADLLAKMTLEEKVNQTLNDFANGA
jgi:beta-glucosidase